MSLSTRYYNAIKRRFYNYVNLKRGWTTKRKIVVIESDDWGSVRIQSPETLDFLLSKGVKLHPELGYDKYDTLASNKDLELLFDTLNSVKDIHGNPAKITFNTVMANPDFEKIKASDYTEYHYELFTETLKRYPNHDRAFALWQEGMAAKLMKPQYHAREHLNISLWLKALREDWEGARISFDRGVYCNYFDKKIDSRGRFLEAYNITDEAEYNVVLNSISEGLSLFHNTFNFHSKSTVSPNYIWDAIIEDEFFKHGILYLQGFDQQKNTAIQANLSGTSFFMRYTGEQNQNNQIYLLRNCLFEPTQSAKFNADFCLANIHKAFQLNKPAIICSHRLNFIGEHATNNRDENLLDFLYLLKEIVKQHPDVEFMSSDELGDIINNQ